MIEVLEMIKSHIPKDFFFEKELKLILPGMTAAARHNQLSRELKKGNLIRLRRGFYCLSKEHQRKGLNLFEISNHLYTPSHISMESALSHYQLIPEAVYTTTAVSARRDMIIETPLGRFVYKSMPTRIFGRDFVREASGEHSFLMADPLKALLDWVLANKRFYSAIYDLEEDLRLDLDRFKELIAVYSNLEIKTRGAIYRKKTITKLIELILWELR